MRLDKFLVECGVGSRKEVKELIKNGEIKVNSSVIEDSALKIKEDSDYIFYKEKKITYKKYRYYIMNKKQGYITAVEDTNQATVMELLPEWVIRKDLFPVGRLDKDTEGLLLFTNDGKLAHDLVSPKKHVDKIYYAELEKTILEKELESLEKGVDIGGYITKPAKATKIDSNKIYLNIQEGKFHQVKKMLNAVGNEVIYLKRISFGKLKLEELDLGEVKEVALDDII